MKKCNFKNSIDIGILTLLGIIPFLPILSIQIPLNIGSYSIIGFSREIICIFLIMISLLSIIKRKTIKLDIYTMIIGIYILYGLFHIIISRLTLELGIDKFRLMYLYPITFFMIYVSGYRLDRKFLYKLQKLIIAQFIIMSCVGILEIIFREDLLRLLYKERYNRMHLNLLGETNIRTVSLLENPINLALFMNISLVVLLFRKKKYDLIDIIFILINMIITLTTLSRTSYFIMAIIIMLKILSNKKILINMVVIMIPIIIIASFYTNTSENEVSRDGVIARRIEQMSMESILENARIENWKSYLKTVFNGDPHLYLWGGGLGSSNPSNTNQSDIVKKVENSYISILGEIGSIGLIMYISIILICLYKIFIMYNNNVLLSKGLIGWMLVLLVGSLTNDLHQNNPFSMYLWIGIFIALLYKPYKINI